MTAQQVHTGTHVPGWINDDMKKYLPGAIDVQGIKSNIPTVSNHERPATFQSSGLAGYGSNSNHISTPWGITPAQHNAHPYATTMDPNAVGGYPVYPGYPTATNSYVPAMRKRRRVRKRPKRDSTSSSSTSGKKKCCNRRHVDSIDEDAQMRHRGGSSVSSSEVHHQDHHSLDPYSGPQFVPVNEGSSSDWGTVPAREMKWNRRRGSFDLFPDWRNPSHHTQKIVQKRKGCC